MILQKVTNLLDWNLLCIGFGMPILDMNIENMICIYVKLLKLQK